MVLLSGCSGLVGSDSDGEGEETTEPSDPGDGDEVVHPPDPDEVVRADSTR
jgi:hypothetical protein